MHTTRSARRSLWATVGALVVTVSLVIAGPVAAANANLGFTNVPQPTISGTGVVGTDFTAVFPTDGIVPQPTTITYNWYVSTGDLLQGGPDATYTPTLNDVGEVLYLEVIIEGDERSNFSYSPFSSVVRLAEFTNVPGPEVTGSGVVGTTFSASLNETGVSPTPDEVAFTWYRVDTSAVVGTGPTLPATSELLGTPVYVIAELTAAGAQPFVTVNSPFSATVRLAEFVGAVSPSVTGSGIVGTFYTATLDTAAVSPEPTSIEFTWYRADTNEVVQVGGDRLEVTRDLVGTPVYVIATLRTAGAQDFVTENSAFSATARLGGFLPGAAPRIEGRNVLQGTLTATLNTDAWLPAPTGISWQWYFEDGTAIEGATSASLPMERELVGEVVYAVATVSAPDTVPYVIATAPSGRIAAPTLTVDDSRRVVAGSVVTVRAFGLLVDEVYALELRSTPVSLGSARSDDQGVVSADVTIPRTTSPGEHRIVLLRDGVVVDELVIDVSAPPAELAATGAADSAIVALSALALSFVAGGAVLLRRQSTPTRLRTMSAV